MARNLAWTWTSLWLYVTFTVLFVIYVVVPPADARRNHRRGRKYVSPKETRGVLKKHAEIRYNNTDWNGLDPYAVHLECPWPCTCQLLKVYCDGRDLTQLPHRLPSEAEVLMAKENRIKRLWQKRLNGLFDLKHLNFKNNKIRYIESSAFIDLENLNSLSLTENRIRHLAPDTFRSQKKLQFLSLKNNRLTHIENLFSKLHRLHLLNVGGNRLKKISENTFKFNPNIRVLDLHNNSIHHVNKHAFRGLPYLKFLVLRDNPLTVVDMDFKLNFHLELLDFTNCKLTEMVHGLPHSINDLRMAENSITELKEDDFKTIRKIRLLVLNNNKITKIHPAAFKKLWQLYDVYLSKNQITEIPKHLPSTLHGFYANDNKIKEIPENIFGNNPKLEFLFLKNNQIKNLEKQAFTGLKKLKSLDLSGNGLANIQPSVFQHLSHLELLDLSSNPIQRIDNNCFDGLTNLHILQMSSVGSQSQLPVVFKDLKNLLFLDLQNSSKLVRHLAENPYVLRYLRSVEDLNLMGAGLYSLPPSFPKHFPRLKALKLINNPWHCDRSIYWLTLWMRRNKVKFFHPEQMLCASPPELKGHKIKDLREDELPTILPPRRQTPYVQVVDIPFKHSINNDTVFFNISVSNETISEVEMGSRGPAQLEHTDVIVVTENPGRKTNKKSKEKTKRPANDVVLGDSGLSYSEKTMDELIVENFTTPPIKPTAKNIGVDQDEQKKGNGEILQGIEDDGSGNIIVTAALARRALGLQSSRETEPEVT